MIILFDLHENINIGTYMKTIMLINEVWYCTIGDNWSEKNVKFTKYF